MLILRREQASARSEMAAWLLLLMLALLVTGGCSRSRTAESPSPEPTLTRIEVDPPTPTVATGSSGALVATGIYENGTTKDVTKDVTWSSADSAVVAITDNGTVTGVAPGTGTVSATLSDVTGTTQLHVNNATLVSIELAPLSGKTGKNIPILVSALGHFSDKTVVDLTTQATWASTPSGVTFLTKANRMLASSGTAGAYTLTASHLGKTANTALTVTEATLLGIDVAVPSPTLGAGTSTPATATGYLSDGTVVDLTAAVTWSSSSAAIALEIGQATPIISGTTAGSATLTASLNGVTGSETITISPALLKAIQIQVDTDQLLVGQSLTLNAIGDYSDGTRRDITQTVLWASDAETFHVSNATASKGLVTAIGAGSAALSAQHGGVAATVTLRSVVAAATRLEISPPAARLPITTLQAFIATATYADGSSRDVTADAIWESSDSQMVSIGNNPRGLATARAVGAATITARFNNLDATAGVTVNAATLESIELSPRAPTLAKGTRATFTALGNFSDGSTLDLTGQAQWQIDGTTAVLADATSEGRSVLAQSAGTSTVYARIGSRVGSTTISVTNAVPTALSIQIDATSLASGTSENLQATATFSDGTSQILADEVVWSSSVPTVAFTRIIAGVASIQALAPGQSIITATHGTLQTSFPITVTPATLTSLSIAGAPSLPTSGTLAQLRAAGLFSDSSTQDLTHDVVWSSSDPSTAVVSNANGNKGELILVNAGAARITASLGGIAGQWDLTITNDPTQPVSIATSASSNIILTTGTDPSTIRAVVKASGEGVKVADGTVVNFAIEQGTGTLNKTSATTVDGVAVASLVSTGTGLIVIRTSVAGTSIANTASVYAAVDFSPALLRGGFFSGEIIDNVVQSGARFGYLVINLSNRSFNALSLQFFHGQTRVSESTDPALLSGGILEAGSWMGVIVSVDKTYQNDTFIALYVLNEPAVNKTFAPALAFRLPPNVAKTN